MKNIFVLLTIIFVHSACGQERLERLRQLQDDAPQAIVSNSDEQIILNEATAIIEEQEKLLERQKQFPGDIEGIREALSLLRTMLKYSEPSPMQQRAATLTQREKELREERQAILTEIQSVMDSLMGCEKCGPDCPCGPDCDCIDGECVRRPAKVQATVRQPRSAVCSTTKMPYVHDGCNCAFCNSKRPKQFMGGITVMPQPTSSGRVVTPSADVRWELVPGSCNSSTGCRYRMVR
jgi:hypothetical protein